ncbi:hypothetical protein [Pseudohongiella spirulinae]|uniref:Uncharacterized protein n=1 Tax=Pseudohongiella spirulinae TaxID=1249552 RepID=A0A0S2KBL6_9GAMM|nr:hypothetical protein [Pseudohongiella spirulinae]ALO45723.1 hypothetical protein PS2015_1058 [Pseudohongiella spirulinae]
MTRHNITEKNQGKSQGFTLVALALGILVCGAGWAQQSDWQVPRTPEGQPDLQGVWANNSSTPLERPEFFGDRATLTAEEFQELRRQAEEIRASGGDALFGDGFLNAVISGEVQSYDPATGNYDSGWMVDRNLENRTSLIIDPPNGRIPPMTEEGRARAQQRMSARLSPTDSYLGRPLQERCITWGMPYIMAGYNSYYQIVQGKDSVAIIQEMIHDVRIVPLGEKPPLDERVKLWHGDSRGWWEGDTLVVQTKNFSDKSLFRGAGENRLFTERYTRVAEDVLQYEFTVEDPSTWERPWTAVINYTASEDPIFEYACHEGNYALMGILSGARAAERAGQIPTE